jgi:hypothetical protein
MLGEVELPEAANPVTLGNAIDLLVRRRILDEAPAREGEKREVVYERGEAYALLEDLRERLASALAAR